MADNDLTLQLPSIPKDCYYEDYVAAILNAGGYYLDRSVHRTEDGLDLLELDVVATKFEIDHYKTTIVEVKSGGWGIKDLFKVNGWLNYLVHNHAAFIYQVAPDKKDETALQTIAKSLKIDLLNNPVKEDGSIDDSAILKSFGIDLSQVPKHAIRALRYSYDLERVMMDYIHSYVKDHNEYQTPGEVYLYFRSLIDESFFIKDPLERLRYLSDISMDHRNIACILDNELKGKGVLSPDECTRFDNLFDIENPRKMECRLVDVALYVQLLNRLLVLKGITEYILLPENPANSWFDEYLEQLNFYSQKSNITHAIEELKKHKYNYLYPYFYQIFFFVYGGFFMAVKKEEEYRVLSSITGVPVNEINNALAFWDTLFPTSTSWMKTINHGGLYYMRFVPAPLRGIGVNYRKHHYDTEGTTDSQRLFDNLRNIVGVNCFKDMSHWNNAAFIMLRQDNSLHQRTGEVYGKYDRHLRSAEAYIHHRAIYSEVVSLKDLASVSKVRNFNLQGFLCKMSTGMYDLYIIKPKNNLLSFPINQVVGELKLDQGHMRYCFVMGTDERNKKTDNDNIWFTSTLHHVSLDQLNSVVDEINRIEGYETRGKV